MNCGHTICFPCYKSINGGTLDQDTYAYVITCPYCRHKEHVHSTTTYGRYHIQDCVFPEKGRWLPMTEDIKIGIASVFGITFDRKILSAEIENGIKIAFTSRSNSTLFVIGTVYKFTDGDLYLSDVNFFQHNGTYYNSYPPNKIYKVDNTFIIYTTLNAT